VYLASQSFEPFDGKQASVRVTESNAPWRQEPAGLLDLRRFILSLQLA
jgi:hypothetical protein